MNDQSPAVAGSPDTIRFGVALGGGSARGYAHIGVLQVLHEAGLRPSLLAGTSFGALIAALYATGLSPAELEQTALQIRRRTLLRSIPDFGLHKAALFEGRRLEAYFELMLDGRHFEDLDLPLRIVATDVDTGERVVLDSGPLAPALRASASLPAIFAPVRLEGRRLADGGLGASVPVDALDGDELDLRIGVGAGLASRSSAAPLVVQRAASSRLGSRICHNVMTSKRTGALAGLGKALAVGARSMVAQQPAAASLQMHTEPPISWLQFGKAAAAIRAGREATARFMPQLHSAILKAQSGAAV